jgi:hypothetical protein
MKRYRILRSFLSPALCAIGLFSLAGCAMPGKPTPSALCQIKDGDGNPIPATFTGTLGVTREGHAANRIVVVQKVETACCNGFDRIVFGVDGFRLPTYTVQYVPSPIQHCASGQNIPVAGTAWLQISMDNAQAHTEEGQPTITDRNRPLNCPNLRQLVQTCDFEGKVNFVFGLNSRKPYRVVELQNPTRLVINVKN